MDRCGAESLVCWSTARIGRVLGRIEGGSSYKSRWMWSVVAGVGLWAIRLMILRSLGEGSECYKLAALYIRGFLPSPLVSLWYPLVSFGILWYPLVSSGILWYPLVSSGILWYPLVSSGILWYPLVGPVQARAGLRLSARVIRACRGGHVMTQRDCFWAENESGRANVMAKARMESEIGSPPATSWECAD
jgi:hypothetical protein